MGQTNVVLRDIEFSLAQLSLDENELAKVVERGYSAYISSTVNDPPLYPGFSAWAMMIRALREYLLPHGWRRSDDSNYSLVINPSGDIAIAVATGDKFTGQPDAEPTTKSSKGPRTAGAVTSNQLHLDLLFPPVELPKSNQDQRVTWILLVHRAHNEIRYELSLPTSMGIDGHVNDWRERIICGAIPVDADVFTPDSPTPPPSPGIQVEVKRRNT